MEESRGAKSAFPSANARLVDGQRQKNIRVAQNIVVEEIACPGVEAVNVQDPSAKRHGQAELVLFVALAVQGQKGEPLLKREIEQRPGHGVEGRRLIVPRVGRPQRPAESRQAED